MPSILSISAVSENPDNENFKLTERAKKRKQTLAMLREKESQSSISVLSFSPAKVTRKREANLKRRRFNDRIVTSFLGSEYDDLVPGSLTGRSTVYRPPPQREEALVRR